MQSIKVVMVGDTQVGKSCVLSKLIHGSIDLNTPPTIGAAYLTKIIATPESQVRLQIWDTAGQEKFRSLAPMYYRSANVVVLVFDVTSKSSLENLDDWAAEIADKAPQGVKTVVLGNKIDLINERCISSTDGKAAANAIGAAIYAETSAFTGDGIDDVFYQISRLDSSLDSIIETTAKRRSNDSETSKCC